MKIIRHDSRYSWQTRVFTRSSSNLFLRERALLRSIAGRGGLVCLLRRRWCMPPLLPLFLRRRRSPLFLTISAGIRFAILASLTALYCSDSSVSLPYTRRDRSPSCPAVDAGSPLRLDSTSIAGIMAIVAKLPVVTMPLSVSLRVHTYPFRSLRLVRLRSF